MKRFNLLLALAISFNCFAAVTTDSDITGIPASGLTNPMTTAGDLIVGGASGAPARLAKGSDTNVLTMVAGSVAWAAAAASGATTALDNLASVAMNVVLKGVNGDASGPAYSFTSDPDTGVYRVTTNTLALAAGGAAQLQVNSGQVLPGSDANVENGTLTNAWLTFQSRFIGAVDTTANAQTISIEGTSSTMANSSVTVQSAIKADYQGSLNRNFGIFTQANGSNNATATGGIYIETGAKSSGTGDAGDVVITTGSSTGGRSGVFRVVNPATKPTCASGIRNATWITQGGAGVADVMEVCMKGTADTYSWVNLATAP